MAARDLLGACLWDCSTPCSQNPVSRPVKLHYFLGFYVSVRRAGSFGGFLMDSFGDFVRPWGATVSECQAKLEAYITHCEKSDAWLRPHHPPRSECSGVQGCGVSGCGVSNYYVKNPSPISGVGVKSPHLHLLRVKQLLFSNPASSNTASLNSQSECGQFAN